MKKSIILDIFNGVKGKQDTMHMPPNEENLSIINKAYEKLKEKSSPELLDLHGKIMDALAVDNCEEVDFYFVEGFKLGLRIGVECMAE